MIHLDTHIAVWLFLERSDRLPRHARDRLEADPVALSPMALLELAYLHEIGRLARTPADVLASLTAALGVVVSDTPFAALVDHAMTLRWTRDPFDRLITANALVDGADLLTADETIRAHCTTAFWDSAAAS